VTASVRSLKLATRVMVVCAAVALAGASACSPEYVLRGAYEHSKILLARRDIPAVIEDPTTAPENREKLRIVLDARSFSERMGLNPGGSFKSFAEVSRDPLAWVVVASRRDAFAMYTWWFPIVGTVPYKGFFDKADAEAQAKELQALGFEASIRGTEAFSTLGWFDDPVVSTTLKNAPSRIANTVIHESVHTTVWIPGSVPFNESLANFVGSQGAVNFFSDRVKVCSAAGGECGEDEKQLAAAQREYVFQFELADLVDHLFTSLEKLYNDPSLTSDEKISRRVEVFESIMKPFRQRYPTLQILKGVNNADIIQLKLYLSNIWIFRELFIQRDQDWGAFLNVMRQVQKKMEADPSSDPFAVLQEIVGR
jgi:predicted aminopeptidase